MYLRILNTHQRKRTTLSPSMPDKNWLKQLLPSDPSRKVIMPAIVLAPLRFHADYIQEHWKYKKCVTRQPQFQRLRPAAPHPIAFLILSKSALCVKRRTLTQFQVAIDRGGWRLQFSVRWQFGVTTKHNCFTRRARLFTTSLLVASQ